MAKINADCTKSKIHNCNSYCSSDSSRRTLVVRRKSPKNGKRENQKQSQKRGNFDFEETNFLKLLEKKKLKNIPVFGNLIK